jgi:hypothetical protein
MPAYSTPGPIHATIQLVSGDLRIEASDRVDTVVDVSPCNESSATDVAAAEQTRVEFADGRLRVIGAKGTGVGFLRRPGSVQVLVRVPTGSAVAAATGLGIVSSDGHLGVCHIRSGAGDVQIADAESIDLVTGLGTLSAERVDGDATCVTGSGNVRVASVGGRARVRNSNGDTWLGNVDAAVRVKASNGSVAIDRAGSDVRVATANGELRVGRVESGTVDLRTALGSVEVGIREGTAARLDVHTSFGTVLNDLPPSTRPGVGESTVEVSVQTSAGDIVIRRAPAAA